MKWINSKPEITIEQLLDQIEDVVMSVFYTCDEIELCKNYLSDESVADEFSVATLKCDMGTIISIYEKVIERFDEIIDVLENFTLKDPTPKSEADQVLDYIELKMGHKPKKEVVFELMERMLT